MAQNAPSIRYVFQKFPHLIVQWKLSCSVIPRHNLLHTSQKSTSLYSYCMVQNFYGRTIDEFEVIQLIKFSSCSNFHGRLIQSIKILLIKFFLSPINQNFRPSKFYAIWYNRIISYDTSTLIPLYKNPDLICLWFNSFNLAIGCSYMYKQ